MIAGCSTKHGSPLETFSAGKIETTDTTIGSDPQCTGCDMVGHRLASAG